MTRSRAVGVPFLAVIAILVAGGVLGGFNYSTYARRSSQQLPMEPAVSSSGRNRRRYFHPRYQSYVTKVRSRPSRLEELRGVRASITSRSRGPTIVNKFQRSGNISNDGKKSGFLIHLPSIQESIGVLRTMHTKLKLRNRADHRRFRQEIYKLQTEMSQLKKTCGVVAKNYTLVSQKFIRYKHEFENFQSDSFNKIQQIEKHQATQDLQYFEVFEATSNNSAEISQMQTTIDSLDTMYGVSDEDNPGDKWVQLEEEPEIAELQFESPGLEEKDNCDYERAHRRILNEVNPRLNEQSSSLISIQNSLSRHAEKLDSLTSDVNQCQMELIANQRNQGTTRNKFSHINHSLAVLHENIRSTDARINLLERQVLERSTEFRKLQSKVEKVNANISYLLIQDNRKKKQVPRNERMQATKYQMSKITLALRQQSIKLNNLSSAIRRGNEDSHYLMMVTSNFFAVLRKQDQVIHRQNETLKTLAMKTMQHEQSIASIESTLSYTHETVMKLLNIVTNIAQQIRRPIPQHKDCHDLWMTGHMESGVYSLVRGMKNFLVFCNMTESGGWTIIQRRVDGMQDFDRDWQEYKDGFGDVFGEYWLGLDTIKWLTYGRIYTLMVVLEDWGENLRYAFYNQFIVFGQDYALMVDGYHGDAGDSLTPNNQESFKVRQENLQITSIPGLDCAASRKAGWWFSATCGDANPNGPYLNEPVETLLSENPPGNVQEEVRWMTWRGEDYPLKKISMQIIPREALDEETFSFLRPLDDEDFESEKDDSNASSDPSSTNIDRNADEASAGKK